LSSEDKNGNEQPRPALRWAAVCVRARAATLASLQLPVHKRGGAAQQGACAYALFSFW
jgi:hypothetical protein